MPYLVYMLEVGIIFIPQRTTRADVHRAVGLVGSEFQYPVKGPFSVVTPAPPNVPPTTPP